MDKKIEAHVFLGYSCNAHCKHCVIQMKRNKIEEASKEKDLTEEQALAHINDLIAKNVYEIVLTGGEPTLRKDIRDLSTYILQNNIKLQTQTNGANDSVIDNIVRDNLEFKQNLSFMIPIHSTNPEEHNQIANTPNGFEHTYQTLQLLKQYGIQVVGKIVLTKLVGNLEDIINLYLENNVQNIIIAYPHCVSFPDEKVYEIAPELEDVQRRLHEIERVNDKCNIILQGIPYCYVNGFVEQIQEDDFEYLNKEVIEYKYKDDYEYKWHIYRKKDKLKFSKCLQCKWNEKCEGIWKEYIRVYGDK